MSVAASNPGSATVGSTVAKPSGTDRLFRRFFYPMATLVAAMCLAAEIAIAVFVPSATWEFHLVVAVTGLFGAGWAVFMAWNVSRSVSRPLSELVAFAERTGQGGGPVTAMPISDAGELVELAKAFNRMADRLASQIAQIDEETDQLRAILGGMVEGVLALDAEQRVLFANERAIDLLDLSASRRPEGRRLWEMVRQRPVIAAVEEAMGGAEPVRKELSWPGAKARSLAVHAARLPFGPEGRSRGAVVVLHDTTELRRLERLRQEFVANVSHELKTPLSVIKICAETLQSGAMDDLEQRGRFIDQIIQQGERLGYLIVDLLSLARIESGQEIYAPQAVPLGKALGACQERLRERAEARRQTIVLEGGVGRCDVWIDEESLAQILDNLVDNAVKYTPEGGKIRLGWSSGDDHASFTVTDNGIGIPAQDLPRIFERFYRVDKARSREMGGTGLGLSIVKHMLLAQGGQINAKSVPGKGTSFTVTLPRA
ncbi:MAG: ATP-binding protein [Planctomycetota bacterium]